MLTVRKLAELAGVSIATVSRALRNEPYVRAEVRQRILALAEEFRYRPNRVSQGIYSGKTGVIGIVLPDVGHPSVSKMFRGALQRAYAASYQVMIQESQADREQAVRAIRLLIEQRVEGLLLLPGHHGPISHRLMLELKSYDIPVVGLGMHLSHEDIQFDTVQTDEVQLVDIVVKYLVDLGHRDIAFVGPHDARAIDDRGHTIIETLKARRLSLQWCLDTVDAIYFTRAMADEVLQQLFVTSSTQPTAIIAWDDAIAALLIQSAWAQRIRIPQDVSIIACSNTPISEMTIPTITTIDQNLEMVGHLACERLLLRMECKETAPELRPETIHTHMEIVIRESCASPRRQQKLAVSP